MNIQQFQQAVARFVRDEEGLTMVEYAVAGGLITLGCALAFTALGTEVANVINAIVAILQGA